MNWTTLKEKVLALPITDEKIKIDNCTIIQDQELFIKSHIRVVDLCPQTKPRTDLNNMRRRVIAYPHYERLRLYYLARTEKKEQTNY